METKPRILYLQKILLERTDEENPLSTTQLINILNDEYGISAHRTTVTKDIAALQEFGMPGLWECVARRAIRRHQSWGLLTPTSL